MLRRRIRLTVPIALLALAACDTTTGLDEVTMEGKWDAVGALGQVAPGLRLLLQPEVNGTFTGTWYFTDTFPQGTVAGQRSGAETVSFTLFNYPGGNRNFSGVLTTILRMSGTMDVGQTDGEAVFLRSSFSP
jgi:hypothetical protein